MMFERFAIDVLLACRTVKGTKELLRITWDQRWHLLTCTVKHGQARKVQQVIPQIGIDEEAFRKGRGCMPLHFNCTEVPQKPLLKLAAQRLGTLVLPSLLRNRLKALKR